MPLVPATWLEEFTVNLTITGTQARPRVTQLTDGNILVSWDSTDNTGVGSAAGLDVIGQLFNPLGERIGTEFRLNDGFTADDERAADVAGLPAGGFVTVYEDFDVGAGTRSIRLTERAADGLTPASLTIADDIVLNEDETFFTPRVVVSSDTSALVVYRVDEPGGTDSRIAGRIYDSVGNTVGTEISLINFAGTNTAPQVAVLADGNYVIAAATVETAGNQVITYRIVSATGANVLGATRLASTNNDAQNDREPAITALTGGGFVITWTNTDTTDTDIQAQRFNAGGVAQGSLINVTLTGATDNANEPAVVALADGGFIVFFDDDANGELRGKRYDAAGTLLSGEFTIATGGGGIDEIDAALLDDGRVAVTFERANGEIGMEIIDVRDAGNATGVYAPQDWQIGTIGNDTITSDGDVFFVAGHDGDDRIITGGFAASYSGGNGNDTVVVTSLIDNDTHDGGAGDLDIIDWSGSGQTGGTFDLGAGTATDASDPGNVLSEAMTGFEGLVGTGGGDSIIGTTGVNLLEGGGGADTVGGDGGVDVLNGGEGDDVLSGGDLDDVVNGDGGNDRIIIGDGDGLDNADGGTGRDTLDYSAVTNGGITLFDMTTGAFTFSGNLRDGFNFEIYLDGNGNSDVTGNAADNRLVGNGGTDALDGGVGEDTLDGGADNDTLDGGSDNDTLFGGTGNDSLFGGTGDDDITDEGGGATAEGGTGNDTMTGSSDADLFKGGADNDRIFGGAGGFDILEGEAGNDAIFGGNGESFLLGGSGNDSLQGGGANDVIEGGADNDTLAGGDSNDTLRGDAGADRLDGGTGNDAMDGGLGNDTYVVDSTLDTVVNEVAFGSGGGIDTVITSVDFTAPTNVEIVRAAVGSIPVTLIGNDGPGTLVGNSGANRLEGRGGNDQVNGNGGADTLIGGEGRDTLVGGAGADTFVFSSVSNSRAGAATRDVINGFERGATQDRIDLSAIDANTLTFGVNNAFVFIGSAAFSATGSAGQLRLVGLGGANAVVVEGDINGDRVADFQVFVNGQMTMTAGDFVL